VNIGANKLINYFVLILLLFLTSCNNYHKTSFKQISEAFNKWYFIYHPDDYLYFDEDNLFKKYDSISTEDYIIDLKRFILELSQININKLSNKSKNDYNHLNYTINNLLFEVEDIKEFENNCSFYINKIIRKIQIIHSSNTYSNYDKKNFILKIVEDSFSYLDKSKFQINNSDNIKNLEENINNLLHLLNEIDISLNITTYDDEFPKILIKYKNYLINYFEWIEDNIKVSIYDNRQELYEMYYNQFFYNSSSYDETIKMLNYYIDDSFINLFNLSLKYYLVDNDEPIWIDRTDSLNVINWTLENMVFTKNLPSCTYESIFENNFNYKGEKLPIDSINVDLCYDMQQKYLNKDILRAVYNKVYNTDVKFYINTYYVNTIVNNVNDSINNTYFDKNDTVNKIIFYLNLYHRYKQIYYQDAYLKSSISTEDIKNNINKSCFFNDENKKDIYYRDIFSKYYYKLNEFITFHKLNNKDDKYFFNENIIDQLINEWIENNINK